MAEGNNKGKIITILVVIVLLLASIAFYSISLLKPPEQDEQEEEEKPIIYKNYPVTSGDLDNNEPSLAINPLNQLNIVAGSNDYNTPEGDAWPGFYTTHDGGKTWKEDLIPGYPGDTRTSDLTGYKGGGDPVIVAANDGTFYYAGIAFQRATNPLNPIGFGWAPGEDNCVFVAKSTNGGDSFDQVVEVWSALHSLVRFNDKEWVAVDPNNSDNVYMVWSIFTGMVTSRLLFSRSLDGGLTWSLPPTVISESTGGEFNIQGSANVVDNDGNIHITWIDFGRDQVRYSKSTDLGSSFSTPVDVSPIDPIPRTMSNNNYRTPTMTMLAVDYSNTGSAGNLYVTWGDYSHGDSDVYLAYSQDNGGSWAGPVRVNNDTEANGIDQFFPAVAISTDGLVHVTFYDRRNDTNNVLLEYWWAISFDHGETFPVNLRISDATFDGAHSRDPGRDDFIGDYTGVVATNYTVAAVWCDTREGSEEDGDSEIYFVAVPYREALARMDLEALGVVWEPEEA